jgi:hypothetical protein
MTTEELRDALDDMPPDAFVECEDSEWQENRPVTKVELVTNDLVVLR